MSNQKILVSLMALGMMVGSNAFASRATEIVNGTGEAGAVLNGGSLYYDDAYNMFYNPAYINDFKNWAIIERSGGTTGVRAQGGFVAAMGAFNFGLYLNRGNAVVSDTTAGTPAGVPTAYTIAPIRPIELFFGGDAGVKWGLGLTYAANHQAGGDSSYVALSLGAEIAGFDPFFTIAPVAKEGLDTSRSWWRGGFKYHFGEWTPYVAIKRTSQKSDTLAVVDQSEMSIGGGIGRSTKLAEGVRMNYAIAYFNVTDKNTLADTKNTHDLLPIDFSLEGDALSWLTIRGGLGYRLVDRYAGNSTVADNTTGRMGATVHFNKNANLEFALGNNPTSPNETAATTDAQTLGMGSGLLTAANFTYTW